MTEDAQALATLAAANKIRQEIIAVRDQIIDGLASSDELTQKLSDALNAKLPEIVNASVTANLNALSDKAISDLQESLREALPLIVNDTVTSRLGALTDQVIRSIQLTLPGIINVAVDEKLSGLVPQALTDLKQIINDALPGLMSAGVAANLTAISNIVVSELRSSALAVVTQAVADKLGTLADQALRDLEASLQDGLATIVSEAVTAQLATLSEQAIADLRAALADSLPGMIEDAVVERLEPLNAAIDQKASQEQLNEAIAAARRRGLVLVLPKDPTGSDLQNGELALAKNTETGRVSLWYRDGSAIIDLDSKFVDVRKYGPIFPGIEATSAQRDANTATINKALVAAFFDKTIRFIDFPAADIYLGQGVASGTIRYNTCLFFVQGCENLILRGNNTGIWLPGENESNYLGFCTFMFNRGRCGFVGEWRIRLQNPATCDGVIVGHVAGVSMDLDLDITPTWGGTSQAAPGSVKNIHRWSPDGRPEGHLAARSAKGLPMWPIAGGAGRRYRVDISGNDGTVDILNTALTAVGVKVSLQHCTYTANALFCVDNEKLIFRPGFVINDAAGMGLAAFGSGIEWDGTIEPPLVNGVRRHLSTNVDGIHLKGCSRDGYVRGRIWGTGDDCINIGCSENNILSVNGGSSVTVGLGPVPSNTPIVGHRVTLVNEAGESKLLTNVATRVDNTDAGTSVLTFENALPSGVGVGWRVVNVTMADFYQVDADVGGNLGAGCRSSAFSGHVALRASRTLLDAWTQGSYFGVEYIPAYHVTIDIVGDRTNSSLDPIRRGYGICTVNPRRANINEDVNGGAAGDFKIDRLLVKDANAPALYMRGVNKVYGSGIHGDSLNPFPNTDGYTGSPFAQFIYCKEVELYNPSCFGTSPLGIHLFGVGRFKMRGQQNISPPTTGATTIDVDALGNGFYKRDGKLWQWGIKSGYAVGVDPQLVFPLPFSAMPSFVPGIRLDDGSVAYMVTVNYSGLTSTGVYLRPRYIGSPDGTVTKVMATNPDITWVAIGDA